MPKFLEKKLKAQYGADSAIPYKIMNKIGAMHGSKETAKGKAMQKKHEADSETHSYDFRKQRGRRASLRMKNA